MNPIVLSLALGLATVGTGSSLQRYSVGPLSFAAPRPVTITEEPGQSGDDLGLSESFTLTFGTGKREVTVTMYVVKRGSSVAEGKSPQVLALQMIALDKGRFGLKSESKPIVLATSHLDGVILSGRSLFGGHVNSNMLIAYDKDVYINIGWGSMGEDAKVSRIMRELADSIQIVPQ